MKKQKHNILILGDQKCKNRDNFIFQTLMKHGRDGDFNITWVNQSYISRKLKSPFPGIAGKIWNRGISLALNSLSFLRFFILSFFTDLIIPLPCNYSLINWVQFAKRFKKTPLITDYYICAALMYEDRIKKENFSNKQYKKRLKLDEKIIETSDVLIHIHKAEIVLICERLGIPVPEEKLVIIPQCIPANPIAQRIPDDKFVIAWWGMISPLHGLDILVAALAELKNTLNFECHLFCLPYPESEVRLLRESIKENQLAIQVHLNTEYTFSNGKLQDFLIKHADLALGHFSDHSEKAATILPTKIVDAMSMNIPVLSRNSKAIEELFDTNDDIFVCDPTPDAIAEALIKIRDNPTERQRRAENGYIKWKSSFTQESFEDRFLDAVRQCIAMGK